MDKIIREAQWKILGKFAVDPRDFALSGGTALELFYLKHRFSRDLDFFSRKYESRVIEELAISFNEVLKTRLKLENEMTGSGRARVRFYTAPIQGSKLPLKIDFIEDVIFDNPRVRKIKNIPVYDSGQIYAQKLLAITGTRMGEDAIGREEIAGRNEARDIVDIYYLSKKVKPLSVFLGTTSRQVQRGMVRWYRTFSRLDFKLGALELELYDKKFDPADVIHHLDVEVERFMEEIVE